MTPHPRHRKRASLLQRLSPSFKPGEPFFDNEFWKRPENEAAAEVGCRRIDSPHVAAHRYSRVVRLQAFQRYIQIHKQAMAQPHDDDSKFLVLKPVAESGNRMLAIVTGFLFALLSDRALVVNNAGFFASLGDLWEKPGFDWTPKQYPPSSTGKMSFFGFSEERRNAAWMELLQCEYWGNMTQKTVAFRGNQCVVVQTWRRYRLLC